MFRIERPVEHEITDSHGKHGNQHGTQTTRYHSTAEKRHGNHRSEVWEMWKKSGNSNGRNQRQRKNQVMFL